MCMHGVDKKNTWTCDCGQLSCNHIWICDKCGMERINTWRHILRAHVDNRGIITGSFNINPSVSVDDFIKEIKTILSERGLPKKEMHYDKSKKESGESTG